MDEIAPHQHRWMMLSGPPVADKFGLYSPGNIRVMPNSSCDICGLTPEAVANEAAIKTLLAENARLRNTLAEAKRLLALHNIDIIDPDE